MIVALAERLVPSTGCVIAGSIRRGSSSCGDIDVVAIDRPAVIEHLLFRGARAVVHDDPRTELHVDVPWSPFPIHIDVWQPDPDAVGACLMHATGPGMYNSVMRRWASMQGMRLRWNGVWRGTERITGATESECCEALGWPNPPPEHRERWREWIDPYLDILNSIE